MTRRFVNQLANGDTIDEVSSSSPTSSFVPTVKAIFIFTSNFATRQGSVGARLWNATENLSRTFEPGDFLQVRGKIQIFQGALQIILSHIDGVSRDQVEPEDFIPQSSQNVAKPDGEAPGTPLRIEEPTSARPGGMLPDRRRSSCSASPPRQQG